MEHEIFAPILLPILHSLVGKVVRINKGPESIVGKLVAARSDYVVVEPVDKKTPKSGDKPPLVFYQIHHIKSIEEEKLPPDKRESHEKHPVKNGRRKKKSRKKTTGF
ncbi:hypothetical protein [Kyrpidia tusciae]|uniref:hypothetical protein n=1 Tax=Kyrpidia tusciae TaxID=33943 RepID=UPI000F4DD42A|nr:hypothetical protein [Kyrpidia tusciae]